MEIIIQLRNAQVAEDFKGIVNEKLKALSRFNVKIDRVEVETGKIWVQQGDILRLRSNLQELAKGPFEPQPQLCACHQQCRHSIGMGVKVIDMA